MHRSTRLRLYQHVLYSSNVIIKNLQYVENILFIRRRNANRSYACTSGACRSRDKVRAVDILIEPVSRALQGDHRINTHRLCVCACVRVGLSIRPSDGCPLSTMEYAIINIVSTTSILGKKDRTFNFTAD